MQLQTLKVSACHESETNPRGAKFEGKQFDELVASIKEKGVLVPVLARKSGTGFEVVAGNRRLRAAKLAGLTEIPAQVLDMTDSEARFARSPTSKIGTQANILQSSGSNIALTVGAYSTAFMYKLL